MQYILASKSPRRRELLSRILSDFEVSPADVDEEIDYNLKPEQIACAIAESKCGAVFKNNPRKTVIASDTIVVFGTEILGKPKNKEDAKATLKKLSGKTHSVITGVCITSPQKKLVNYERTEVTFNDLSDKFIEEYVNGGSPMDKAGSYGIQDEGVVSSYRGSYTNVVGLPVALVKNMLEEVQR